MHLHPAYIHLYKHAGTCLSKHLLVLPDQLQASVLDLLCTSLLTSALSMAALQYLKLIQRCLSGSCTLSWLSMDVCLFRLQSLVTPMCSNEQTERLLSSPVCVHMSLDFDFRANVPWDARVRTTCKFGAVRIRSLCQATSQ